MSTYLNIPAEELNIGDYVKKRGRVIREVVDHERIPGYVVVVFEKRREDVVAVLRGTANMQVMCVGEDR